MEEWYRILLSCVGTENDLEVSMESQADMDALELETQAAFSDGLNTGFYINAYTTKQCPTMEGVLEEMRRGLERLQQQREQEQEMLQQKLKSEEKGLKGALSADARAQAGRSRFAQALDVVKRLSASYRRCYWRSGSEMLFPIFFGHMTFTSHRCWSVYVKKGVWLAAEAWRRKFGEGLQHEKKNNAGGQSLRYVRSGLDPYVLAGWRQETSEDGSVMYLSPDGVQFKELVHAYEHDVALKAPAVTSGRESKQVISFLEKFLQDSGAEREERKKGGDRVVVTTSSLEDWLFRGEHPLLAPMSLYVYSMWVYRVEKASGFATQRATGHVDIPYAEHYNLRHTHFQRVATEYRVPLFEGFTMPTCNKDSETASLYKQLLLRPLAVLPTEQPEDERMLNAFAPMSSVPESEVADKNRRGQTAFTRVWFCLLYTSPSPRDGLLSRMPSSA